MAATESTSIDSLRDAIMRMPVVATLGLRFTHMQPGETEIEMPVQPGFCFRPGQLQATAIYAIADFAAVSAAATLLPKDWTNATVDTTLKLIAPARGTHLRARGRVVQAGRLLTVCAADVFAVDNGEPKLCATLLATARNVAP